MRARRWLHIGGSVLAAAGVGAWMQVSPLAKDEQPDESAPTRSTRRAPDDARARTIGEKLADVQTNQQEILSRLAEVLKEIGYAKTRSILR